MAQQEAGQLLPGQDLRLSSIGVRKDIRELYFLQTNNLRCCTNKKYYIWKMNYLY